MNIILTAGILLIIFSSLFRKKLPPYIGLLVVFIIMGFQDGIPGDYFNYKYLYDGHAGLAVYHDTEPIWELLFRTFSLIMPFWGFVLIMTGFECLVLARVGGKYGSKEYGWVGPILFFFSFYMMLVQIKALREGLSVEFIVLSIYLASEKKGTLKGIGFFLVAMFIHEAAIVALPLVLTQIYMARHNDHVRVNKNEKKTLFSKMFPFILLGVYIFIYTLKVTALSEWLEGLAMFTGDSMRLSSHFERDLQFAEGNEMSILVVIYNGIMVFLSSWLLNKVEKKYFVLILAAIIGCFIEMLFWGIGSLPRIGMYFIVFNIYTYTILLETISYRYGKIFAFTLIVLLVGYAMKSSLPMILNSDTVMQLASYKFIFM